jgi:uncharacterized protein (DUF433 family)
MSPAATRAQIVKTPGICGGRARIDGHRIRVQDIAIEYEWQGLSPEEICREHPGLNLAQVHTALAYYFEHRDEIESEIRTDEGFVADQKRQQASRDPASGHK